MDLKKYIRSIPDYPKKGILFRDITTLIKNIDALPKEAKNYIHAVEDFIGAKISSISTSPEREDTILIENPFDL